jgi:acid phosphatase
VNFLLFALLLVVAPLFLIAQVPVSDHVFLVVEENHGYSDVAGNPQMPFLNQLASTYGLATQYFGNVHPSIGNYFMLTTGQLITTDDSFSGVVTGDNIVRELLLEGRRGRCMRRICLRSAILVPIGILCAAPQSFRLFF